MLNLKGVKLSSSQVEEILRLMADARNEPTYLYPWDSLEDQLSARNLPAIPVVGYGSLVNSSSAAQTLHDRTLKTSQPTVAFGIRRLFNYEMPPGITRYEPPTEPLARAALNVRVTGRVEDFVNGILMNTALADIPAMRKREVGYDLIPVACLDWNNIEKPPFLGYILRCPDDIRENKRWTNDEITPHRQYYQICRQGAGQFGRMFLTLWLESTYLADGVTTVKQWEATGLK